MIVLERNEVDPIGAIEGFVWIIITITISFVYDILFLNYQEKNGVDKSFKRSLVLGLGGIKALWLAFCVVFGVILPVMLMGYHLLTMAIVRMQVSSGYRAQMTHTLTFLMYAAVLLLVMGSLSLVLDREPGILLTSVWVRGGLIFITYTLMILFFVLLRRIPMETLDLEHEYKQDRSFLIFLLCCVVYVYTDAIFCGTISRSPTAAILLIAGNFLLMLLVFMFFKQKMFIAKNRLAQKELEELSAQKAHQELVHAQLRRTMDTDVLTACHSRRYIVEQMKQLQLAKILFCVIFIDINGLKDINDRYGHDIGDGYLTYFAKSLSERLKDGDELARIGGDEFLVVMPWTQPEDARIRMAKIRREIFELRYQGERISFSFGVSSGDYSSEVLIDFADKAMYEDKRLGKLGGQIKC